MTPRRLAAVPDAPRRAGLYVRVSKVGGRSGEDFLSPTVQVDTMKAAADRAGDRVVEVWEDFDRTGRTVARREGLAAAQAAAREGRIDVLYVYSLHRWARNAADGLAELAEIERQGVPVESATENADRSTTSGRLTVGLLLLLAEHQSDVIGDAWRGVIEANARRGVWHGHPPLGYIRSGKREISPDPVLGPAMTEAFRRFAAGEPVRSIARDLGRLRGAAVLPTTLRRTLQSQAYLGRVLLHGQALPGRHEPLTDEATFAAVQRRLSTTAATPSRTTATAHPLAGLLRCEGCGWTLYFRRRKDRPELPPFYACGRRHIDGSSTCPGIGTPRADLVVAAVLDRMRAELVDVPDTAVARAVARAQRERGRGDIRALSDEVARTEKALAVLVVKNAQGLLSDTAYRVGASALEDSLTGLRDRLFEAESAADAPAFTAKRDLATALLDLWPSMTVAEQNEALRTHVREAFVRRASGLGEPMDDRVRVVLL